MIRSNYITTLGGAALIAAVLAGCNNQSTSQSEPAKTQRQTSATTVAKTQQVPSKQKAQQGSGQPSNSTPGLKGTGALTSAPPHYNVHFALNSAALSPEAQKTMSDVVKYLRLNPDSHVTLNGYTDATGSAAYNKALAGRRVASAAQYLKQQNIDESRINTNPVGEAAPAMAPEGENAATWNRRVEITVTKAPMTQ